MRFLPTLVLLLIVNTSQAIQKSKEDPKVDDCLKSLAASAYFRTHPISASYHSDFGPRNYQYELDSRASIKLFILQKGILNLPDSKIPQALINGPIDARSSERTVKAFLIAKAFSLISEGPRLSDPEIQDLRKSLRSCEEIDDLIPINPDEKGSLESPSKIKLGEKASALIQDLEGSPTFTRTRPTGGAAR